MQKRRDIPLVIIFQYRSIGIFIPQIHLGCCQAVFKHFHNIAVRHPSWYHFGIAVRIIDPVFKMMLIAPFMMQPGRRIPLLLAFRHIRTAIALIVFHAVEKLLRRILGQIVHQALPVQPHCKTAFHHQQPVMCDRLKMTPNASHLVSPFLKHNFLYFIIKPLARKDHF